LRDYEVVYIFDSQIEDERINEKLERFQELLIAGETPGEITATDHWGRRQLAVPIRKRTNGYYVVTQCKADSSALPEFERLLKLDEDLLRYLVVLHEGEPTAPMSLATRDPDKERGEDDDDEED
jgi:small subunit ribosomal protein S6